MDLKVYHQLAFLASDENGCPERQIKVDSHGGMEMSAPHTFTWALSKVRTPRCSPVRSRARHRGNFKGCFK